MNKISVIVPIYKVEKYIDKCIESIVNQSYENLEIILVDDGSPDNCGKICDQYQEKDERIKVIHQKNQGLSEARNAGLRIASGEYLGFVDSDDWIRLNMYEKLMKEAIDTGADIVCCRTNYVDEKGNHIRYSKQIDYYGNGLEYVKSDGCRYCNPVWNKLYKKKLFDDIEFPKGKKFEDARVMHKLYSNADIVKFIDYVGYNYLKRNGSITADIKSLTLIDKAEASLIRANYLAKIGAQTNAIRYWLKMYYSIWSSYDSVGALKNPEIKEKLDCLNIEYKKLDDMLKTYHFDLTFSSQKRIFDISPDMYCKISKGINIFRHKR